MFRRMITLEVCVLCGNDPATQNELRLQHLCTSCWDEGWRLRANSTFEGPSQLVLIYRRRGSSEFQRLTFENGVLMNRHITPSGIELRAS